MARLHRVPVPTRNVPNTSRAACGNVSHLISAAIRLILTWRPGYRTLRLSSGSSRCVSFFVFLIFLSSFIFFRSSLLLTCPSLTVSCSPSPTCLLAVCLSRVTHKCTPVQRSWNLTSVVVYYCYFRILLRDSDYARRQSRQSGISANNNKNTAT